MREATLRRGVRLARAAAPGLLLLALAAPPAVAADVAIVGVESPELVVYNRTFPVEATVENLGGGDATVRLFTAIYTPDESPCGSSAGDDYHGEVSTRSALLRLGPRERATYPGDAERRDGFLWWHRVNASNDAPGAGDYEMCVFAVDPTAASPEAYWQDYRPVDVRLRMTNAAPGGRVAVEPAEGTTDTTFTFRATASDADGDDVTYHWDFNDWTAKGPATATGAEATHRFYPAGVYTVNLTLSDGWDERVVTTKVVVREPGALSGDRLPVPAAGAPLALLAAALVTLAARPRSPPPRPPR